MSSESLQGVIELRVVLGTIGDGVRVVLWASDLTLQNDWPHEARPGHLPMGHTREDQGCPVWPLAEWLLPCKQADTFLVHGLMDPSLRHGSLSLILCLCPCVSSPVLCPVRKLSI